MMASQSYLESGFKCGPESGIVRGTWICDMAMLVTRTAVTVVAMLVTRTARLWGARSELGVSQTPSL